MFPNLQKEIAIISFFFVSFVHLRPPDLSQERPWLSLGNTSVDHYFTCVNESFILQCSFAYQSHSLHSARHGGYVFGKIRPSDPEKRLGTSIAKGKLGSNETVASLVTTKNTTGHTLYGCDTKMTFVRRMLLSNKIKVSAINCSRTQNRIYKKPLGSSVSLACRNPKPGDSIQWQFNKHPLNESAAVLNVTKLSESDAGIYRCFIQRENSTAISVTTYDLTIGS